MPRPLHHLETRSGDPRDGSYQRQQRAKAARLWSRSRSIEGTPAERYLRQARCYLGPIPKTLAFLPPIREPAPGVLGIPRNVDAVHLTLLRSDGSGKADIERNKLTIGQPRARPIMLAPPNDLLGLAICEGIEDGLSVYEATGLGVWAAGSAVYMPALAGAVPNYVEALTIYAHNDSGGQYALQLAKKLLKRGIEPFIEGLER
jgi:putative DNA primase/helicase